MQTETNTTTEVDYSLLDFRKSEQLISKPQPNDDNDDYEDEYTDSY